MKVTHPMFSIPHCNMTYLRKELAYDNPSHINNVLIYITFII
jgi:hypothetical protein